MSKVAVKGLNLVLVVFSLLVLGAAAYFLSKNSLVNYKSGASNIEQSITGYLVKKGTSCAKDGKANQAPYAISGENPLVVSRPSGGGGTISRSMSCTGLFARGSVADSLINQKVVATGTMQNGFFYATKIVKASNLEPAGTPRSKFTPGPTATAIPCPGLKGKATCDPKATSPTQKCCAPYSCQGVWDAKTGAVSNYACSTGSKAL